MLPPLDAARIAALRQEIRRAGRNTGWTRRLLAGSFLVATVAICVYAWATLLKRAPDESPFVDFACTITLSFGVGCSLVIALPLAVLYRLRRVKAMRRWLQPLSPEDRAAVLLPLQREASDDTRKVVARLLSELGVTTAPNAPTARRAARGTTSPGT